MSGKLLTFWGKLKSNETLVTSEGTLHYVIHDNSVPYDVYGFFFVEKRKRKHIILKFLNETILVPKVKK